MAAVVARLTDPHGRGDPGQQCRHRDAAALRGKQRGRGEEAPASCTWKPPWSSPTPRCRACWSAGPAGSSTWPAWRRSCHRGNVLGCESLAAEFQPLGQPGLRRRAGVKVTARVPRIHAHRIPRPDGHGQVGGPALDVARGRAGGPGGPGGQRPRARRVSIPTKRYKSWLPRISRVLPARSTCRAAAACRSGSAAPAGARTATTTRIPTRRPQSVSTAAFGDQHAGVDRRGELRHQQDHRREGDHGQAVVPRHEQFGGELENDHQAGQHGGLVAGKYRSGDHGPGKRTTATNTKPSERPHDAVDPAVDAAGQVGPGQRDGGGGHGPVRVAAAAEDAAGSGQRRRPAHSGRRGPARPAASWHR